MLRMGLLVAVAAPLAIVLGAVVPRETAAATETYLFHDTFAPEEGAGNVLVPVSNATGTILSEGASFVNGAFVTETIGASACPASRCSKAGIMHAAPRHRGRCSGPRNGGGRFWISGQHHEAALVAATPRRARRAGPTARRPAPRRWSARRGPCRGRGRRRTPDAVSTAV